MFTKADSTQKPKVLFTKADVTRKPRGVTQPRQTSRGSLEVLLTKTDVTRKPGLARGPVAFILHLSIPFLDKTTTKYQTPKQYCDHSDHLAGETNSHKHNKLLFNIKLLILYNSLIKRLINKSNV
jgi:hypothetical protein